MMITRLFEVLRKYILTVSIVTWKVSIRKLEGNFMTVISEEESINSLEGLQKRTRLQGLGLQICI